MFSIKKEINSFKCAFRGIFYALKNETHLKIHSIIALLVCVLGFILKISAGEWLACLLCFAMVFSVEILNTAIEKIVDFISPEQNEHAGRIKDISAGAVFICAIISVIIGIIIFLPKIIGFLIFRSSHL